MEKISIVVILCAVFLAACSGGRVTVAKFSGIYPGMECSALDSYLTKEKVPFKKDGDIYKFTIKEKVWKDATVTCKNVVSKMDIKSSSKGSPSKNAGVYIDAQTLLLDAFRENMITYEEGNKIVNLNNGIKLHQFADEKSGMITSFEISIDDAAGSKEAWQTASALLPKIGVEK